MKEEYVTEPNLTTFSIDFKFINCSLIAQILIESGNNYIIIVFPAEYLQNHVGGVNNTHRPIAKYYDSPDVALV